MGFDCVHTLDLPNKNLTTDQTIRVISLQEQRIVITKDSDFFHSFLLKREPYKLVFVTIGNMGTSGLKQIFKTHFNEIISALKNHSMIELNQQGIKIII